LALYQTYASDNDAAAAAAWLVNDFGLQFRHFDVDALSLRCTEMNVANKSTI